jgi:Ni/Co efflux regulator RcnB
MKRLILMLAAAASVSAAMPLTAPAFARDGDQGRRAERHDRGRGHSGQGGKEAGPGRWESEGRRRGDDRPQYDGPRRRGDDRPRYEGQRRYEDGPRPNYMRPYGEGARRGGAYLPDGYRGGMVDDYRRYRLRPPPHGYAWVRMGNGFALVEMGSGRIFDRVD